MLAGATQPTADISATITNLRSTKGRILACLTMRADKFPACENDPTARSLIVPATEGKIHFGAVPAGNYAIAVIHDENSNGKLDKRLIIPREGFGFSRDAPVMMGPPSFSAAVFAVGTAAERLTIKMRYLL